MTLGRVRLDRDRHRLVGASGRSVHLEPLHAKLLAHLMDNRGRVQTREQLLDEVWGRVHGTDQSLSNAVSHIRKALHSVGCDHVALETVPKKGYVLRLAEDERVGAHPAADRDGVGVEAIPRRRGHVAIIAASLMLLILVGAAFLSPSRATPSLPAITEIAVEGFASPLIGGETTILGDRIADGVHQQLEYAGARTFGNGEGDYVLRGSVRREGPLRIAVEAHLVERATGKTVWRRSLSQTNDGIALAESSLAEALIADLDKNPGATDARYDTETRARLAQAKMLTERRDAVYFDRAVGIYEEILKKEGDVADAKTGLADILFVRAALKGSTGMPSPAADLKRAAALAKEALSEDPADPRALMVLGSIDLIAYRLKAAEQRLAAGAKSGTLSAPVLNRYNEFLAVTGRAEEHRDLAERIVALDPFLTASWRRLAQARLATGDPKGAVQSARMAVELEPGNRDSRIVLVRALGAAGDREGLVALRRELERMHQSLIVSGASESPFTAIATMADIAIARIDGNAVEGLRLARTTASANGDLTLQAHLFSEARDFDSLARLVARQPGFVPYFLRFPLFFPWDDQTLADNPAYARLWQNPKLQIILNARRENAATAR